MEESLSWIVYRKLRHVHYKTKKEVRNKLAQEGITWPQFHALYHIGEEDGITTKKLAKKLNCNASNMTGIIDRMEENNWVYRQQSEDDRRIWIIKLTQEGEDFRNKLIPVHHKNIKEYMGILSEQELLTLAEILDKLLEREAR